MVLEGAMTMAGQPFRDLSELTLMDDYMFGVVMQDPEVAKLLIGLILDMRLRSVQYVEPQRVLKEGYDAKGVRLDLYVEDEQGRIYNVEVQTTDKRDLPRRMRYYQSVIDQEVLKPGAHYRSLPPSYVIFICGFDPFGLNRCVYTFENRCLEVPQLGLGDGAVKVLVNIRGLREGVSAELRELLDYLSTGTVSGPASRVLSNAVDHVKQSEERRREYMLSMVRDMELKAEAREEGRQEGRVEGRQEGRAEGIVQLSALVDKLLALGRIDDISRVTKDAEYRDKLLKEYHLA